MYLTVDNRKAFAYTGGQPFDPGRPTIVFIHGAAHDHSVWALQSRYFAHHGCNVLAIDLPGHGRSERPLLNTVPAMADWVMRLCDAAGMREVSLVGHSMGSLIAVEAASRNPERIKKLALLGTAYPMHVSDALLDAARDNEPEAWQMVNVWSHAPAMLMGGNPNPGMWLLGRNLRVMQRCAPGVMYSDLKACNDYRGGEAATARVTCPTLLLLGQRDLMTPPKVGATLGKAITSSRTVVIDGAGHSMMAEAPDAVLDALIGFVIQGR